MKYGIGLWVPRTYVHFLEILRGLKNQQPNPYIEKKDYRKLLGNFLEANTYYENDLTYLKIKYAEGDVYIFPDGVLIVSNENLNKLLELYNRFRNFAKELFKVGMPVPAYIIKDLKPVVIRIGDCNKYFIEKNQYLIIKEDKICVKKENIELIREALMFHSSLMFSKSIIDLHRKVWEDIEKIRKKVVLKAKEIIEVKRQLENYILQLKYVGIRLKQMIKIINNEKFEYIDKRKILEMLYYTEELWKITEEYSESLLRYIESIEWALHQHELESVRTFAMLYVIVALGELIFHPPLEPKTFVIFILGALLIAYIIHKISSLIAEISYKRKRHKLFETHMEKVVKEIEEESSLEAFHLG